MSPFCRLMVSAALVAVPASPLLAQAPKANRPASPKAKAAAAPVEPQAPAPPLPDPALLDDLLKKWEEQSRKTTTLDASFVEISNSVTWQKKTERTGRAILKAPNLAYLNFEKVSAETGKPASHERLICAGDSVYQFIVDSKVINVYPLDKNDRKRALEQGPLPFLFNMKAAEAKQRYKMVLRRDDPTTYVISITPLQEIDRDGFSMAYILLSKETFLPERLTLLDPSNGKDTKTYIFSKITRNGEIAASFFDGKAQADKLVNLKWKLIYNPAPANDVREQAGGHPLNGPVPRGTQPAMRPSAKARTR